MFAGAIFDCVLFPLIGLLIALFGVFFDAKTRPKSFGTIILITLLLLMAVCTGLSAWNKNKQSDSDHQKADKHSEMDAKRIDTLQQTIATLSSKVGTFGDTLSSVADNLGISKNNRSPATIVRSLQAGEVLHKVVSPAAVQSNGQVTIQFFPKQIDRDLVQSVLESSLSRAGFHIQYGIPNPLLHDAQTNWIWYGKNVSNESIRTVALALIRAGIEIRGIEPIPDLNIPNKDNLIQIGSYSGVEDKSPFTVDQISAMNFRQTAPTQAMGMDAPPGT